MGNLKSLAKHRLKVGIRIGFADVAVVLRKTLAQAIYFKEERKVVGARSMLEALIIHRHLLLNAHIQHMPAQRTRAGCVVRCVMIRIV